MGGTHNILCLEAVKRVDNTKEKEVTRTVCQGQGCSKNNRSSHARLREKG